MLRLLCIVFQRFFTSLSTVVVLICSIMNDQTLQIVKFFFLINSKGKTQKLQLNSDMIVPLEFLGLLHKVYKLDVEFQGRRCSSCWFFQFLRFSRKRIYSNNNIKLHYLQRLSKFAKQHWFVICPCTCIDNSRMNIVTVARYFLSKFLDCKNRIQFNDVQTECRI